MLDGAASLAAQAGDLVRRVRFRCADLQRISPAEMASDRRPFPEAPGWLPAVRIGARSHAALSCDPGSRVTYSVTLPANATLACWCALAEGVTGAANDVEFEIHVYTSNEEASVRRLVPGTTSGPGRQWHPLRIKAPEAGAARIVLNTRLAHGTATPGLRALWGHPRIEAPRPPADLVRVVRSVFNGLGLRGLRYKTMPPDGQALYQMWVRENEPSRAALRAQHQQSLGRERRFTLVTFVSGVSGPSGRAAWRPDRTWASLQQQSYPAWEWMLVATDDSIDQVKAFAARAGLDPRMRVHQVPAGTARADGWNAGLREARGEFAAVLDPADTLAPAAFSEMAAAIERSPGCDVPTPTKIA